MRLLGVLVSALLWTAVYAIPVDGGGNGKPVGKPGPGGGSGGMDNLEIDLNLNPYLPSFLKCLEDTVSNRERLHHGRRAWKELRPAKLSRSMSG